MTKLALLKSYLTENVWNASYTEIKPVDSSSTDVNTRYGNNALGFRKIIACWRSDENTIPSMVTEGYSTMECDSSTTYYAANTIYHMAADISGDSNLNNGLLFCKNSHLGQYNWSNARLVDSAEGYISFIDNIVDPDVVCILGGPFFEKFSIADEPSNFTPYALPSGIVNISDDDYDLCIQCLGYPFITEDELEYTREQITNLAIKPALDEYFKWFPKVDIQTFPLSSASVKEVQFPEDAYDVVHFDVQQGGASLGGGAITNTLWRSFEDGFYGVMNIGSITGSYFGTRAPTTSTSSINSYLSARAAMQGVVNYNTRTDFRKYEKDGKMYAAFYSTKGGVGEVHWAMRTHNFDDIEFAQRNNVINYCAANVKLLFANLRKQIKTDIPGQYDYGTWISEANDVKDKITTEWKEIVKSSGAVLRGGLG